MVQLENRRIIVIDDEPSMHADFRSVLAPDWAGEHVQLAKLEASMFGDEPLTEGRRSFVVSSAHQGCEGLEMARAALAAEQPFAVAFVDMRMPPGWDGLQTVTQLWKLDSRLQIVFCTAYSPYSWEESLHQYEAQDRLLVIKKPFDPIEIWQAACTLSAKWSYERQAEATIAALTRQYAPRAAPPARL